MSRSQRLLELIQLLRSHRFPVPGKQLAQQLGVSLRTLYRDIATLQAQGAHIEGAAGLGYVLRPGFTLPPLMFTEEEIEAIVLGSRWVAKRGDTPLGAAASSALVKIAAVLPQELQTTLDSTTLLIGPSAVAPPTPTDIALLRRAIRSQQKLIIRYRDASQVESTRTVWPFALGYFDQVRVLLAWCETRCAIRHFRADRIASAELPGQRYPKHRQTLLKEWRVHNPADKN